MASPADTSAIYTDYVAAALSNKEPESKELLAGFLSDVLEYPLEFAGGQWMIYNHGANALMALTDDQWNKQLSVYYNTVTPPFQGCILVPEASRAFTVGGLRFKIDVHCVCATDTSSEVPNAGIVPTVLVGWTSYEPCHIYVAKVVAASDQSAESKLAPFMVGHTIVVIGLKAKPEHNDKTGEIVGFQGDRIQVRLTDSAHTELALRPANLRPVGDTSNEAAQS